MFYSLGTSSTEVKHHQPLDTTIKEPQENTFTSEQLEQLKAQVYFRYPFKLRVFMRYILADTLFIDWCLQTISSTRTSCSNSYRVIYIEAVFPAS